MSTPQQINANLANAQLSTGPRTTDGKQKSSANSLKHGLTATSIEAFAPEIRAAYHAFRQDLERELRPASTNEQICFEQYAFAQFLYLKAQSLEANALQALMADPNNPQLESRFNRATRYLRSKVAAARAALKQFELFQANRLAAAEMQQHILATQNLEIEVPITTPFHLILSAKSQRINPEAASHRLILAEQNEANRTPASPVSALNY